MSQIAVLLISVVLFLVSICGAEYPDHNLYERDLDDHEAYEDEPEEPEYDWKEITRQSASSDPEDLEKIVGSLGRQLMLTQLLIEERIRSDGGSGLKQVQVTKGGSSVAAIHEHSNNIRTVGLGEFVAVLNGVEFRTRHNDYRLKQPIKDDDSYHATEYIDFPDVPPEVTGTLEEQIEELRLWFKAFKDQNTTLRDYRPYFPPVLCYLEGAWTLGDDKIDEPFIEAEKWVQLQEKIHFTSARGRKSHRENFAFLPTTILEMVNGTYPRFAQWNYRIMCHKLSRDVKLKNLHPIDDISTRFARKWDFETYLESRAPRFQFTDHPHHIEDAETGTLLDKLMYEIPGKNNYGANIVDDVLDAKAYPIDSVDSSEPLNAAYYHRYFRVQKNGAIGLSTRHRGFSDPNLFVALNTQPKIAPFNYSVCTGKNANKVCNLKSQRVSYAIPLELIYLTPLWKWNPYNLTYRGDAASDEGKAVIGMNENGEYRNGKETPDLAYNGTNSKYFYITPVEFYAKETSGETDAAGTAASRVGVLDPDDVVRSVSASGTRIFMSDISGVGRIRQRYPIMPIHAEGNAIWQKLSALEDSLMSMEQYRDLSALEGTPVSEGPYVFYTSISNSEAVNDHFHTFPMSSEDFEDLLVTGKNYFTSSYENGHDHLMEVKYDQNLEYFIMSTCDGLYVCWDNHLKALTYTEE